MKMLPIIEKTIRRYGMFSPGEKILCGFSGGADSTALLYALYLLSDKLTVSVLAVHVHHGIRGAEADRDADFCRDFCQRRKITFHSVRVDAPEFAARNGTGLEEAARILRYRAFDEICAKTGCTRIATAHNSSDNAETVLFHLTRGSGIDGLCGIPPVRGSIVRPLLFAPRECIIQFLSEHSLSYVTDSTNTDPGYTRNRIRNEVLPVFRTINPAYLDNITSAAMLLRNDAAYLDSLAEQCSETLAGNLRALPPAILSRRIRSMFHEAGGDPACLTSRHIADVMRMLESSQGRAEIHLPCGLTAFREYDCFSFAINNDSGVFTPIRIEIGKRTEIPGTEIALNCTIVEKDEFNNSFNTFYLNCDIISGYLELRNPIPADRFRRNAGSGSKPLTRIFSDMKMPLRSRRNALVLSDRDMKPLAVVGLGINYEFIAKKGFKTLRIDVLY